MNCTADPVEDCGSGVTIERRYLDGVLSGLGFWHPIAGNLDAPQCEGYIPIGGPDGWTVEVERPLTLKPSILCTTHHFHGHITAGAWFRTKDST